MNLSSTCGSSSIFQDGKLKPEIYKIQSLHSETYLGVHLHSMELCCRPAGDLGGGRGLWKIRRFWDGYAVWRVDPGNPYQFCNPRKGIGNGDPVCVTAYPVGWRIERANGADELYRGFGYVRFLFGPIDRSWDLWGGNSNNGEIFKVWRLIPVEVEGMDTPLQSSPKPLGLGLPPYDENEPEQSNDFGTVVTEVTVITTRKKYRVDA